MNVDGDFFFLFFLHHWDLVESLKSLLTVDIQLSVIPVSQGDV